MSDNFEQISLKPGFMKHNGGVLFRSISNTEYEFKSTINENHLNVAGITHGGYLSALIDAGAGTAAHRAAENAPCVTISLDLKFIGASKIGDTIDGYVKILKKTRLNTEDAHLRRRLAKPPLRSTDTRPEQHIAPIVGRHPPPEILPSIAS